eukprot:CAMPEP_0197065644 /NCGR_PEP_ID=MMETSP1384-20130603/168402_1 /TAXON_ID=29189 /ORGANISM="Ammonia sp." /LENGTH=57 /DNA_ID=CAMNT_0042502553 /DNA_START=1 /DNA_END=174 /DNA_ORIENTATION=-
MVYVVEGQLLVLDQRLDVIRVFVEAVDDFVLPILPLQHFEHVALELVALAQFVHFAF